MFTLIRFLAVLAISVVSVGVGSVAWPKITTAPRPEFLEKAYTITKQTPLGVKTAEVLGVTDPPSEKPINVSDIAQTFVSTAAGAVEKRVQTIIATQAALQLMHQITSLDPRDQADIRALICSTQSAQSR